MARLWKLVETHEYDHFTDTCFERFRIEIFAHSADDKVFRANLTRWGDSRVRQGFVGDPSWIADDSVLVRTNLLDSEEMTAGSAQEVLDRVLKRLESDGYD